MAHHIIWNASGYMIGLSANDTDKDYFLTHEPTASTTTISEADFLSLARKEKQLLGADHSLDNTDETVYECTKDSHQITDWDCGGRIANATYFKEILQGIITQCENHLAFHTESVGQDGSVHVPPLISLSIVSQLACDRDWETPV